MEEKSTTVLIGYPTYNPKTIKTDESLFLAFGLATQDCYQNEEGCFQTRKPVFHDILVFDEKLIKAAKKLTTKDQVKITGSLYYKFHKVKNQQGIDITLKTASITATNIEPQSKPKP